MARSLSDREHRRLENLARKSDHHRLFAAIADFHAPLNLDRKLLIGTSEKRTLYVQGFQPLNRILDKFRYLDARFDQGALIDHVYATEKRTKAEREILRGPVQGTIHKHYLLSFPSLCFLAHAGNCSQTIIHAHAVQEAQLKLHAKDGKVYFASPMTKAADGEVAITQLTVRRATTFRGFCSTHDSATFRAIETFPFAGTPEQIFLYHYRALCKDYYLRLVSKNYFTQMLADFRSQGFGGQVNFVEDLLAMTQGDIDEFVAGKSRYDGDLANRNFGGLSGCWMRGQGIPGLIGTTFLFPPVDLLGRSFPNRRSALLQNWISVTTTIESGTPLTIVAGLSDSPLLRQFMDSMRIVPRNDLPAILLRFALALSENFVLVPKWWEGLTHDERRAARMVFTNRYYTDYFQGRADWSFDPPNYF